jgi:hypothetical protein
MYAGEASSQWISMNVLMSRMRREWAFPPMYFKRLFSDDTPYESIQLPMTALFKSSSVHQRNRNHE